MDKLDKILFEETRNRLISLCEFTVFGGNDIVEAEEPEQDIQPEDGGEMPPMGDEMGPDNNNAPQGFAPQEDEGEMGPDAGQEGEMLPMDGAMEPDGGDMPTEDDEVVDITDLTDAQKDTEDEISNLSDEFDDKFVKILKQLKSFEDTIKSNDAKIADLKAELEKRNPNPIEKMSMRSMKSEPYNISMSKYWNDKQATSNYSIEDDSIDKDDTQYTITNKDVNTANDWMNISKSFNDDDFIYNQTLNGVLGY